MNRQLSITLVTESEYNITVTGMKYKRKTSTCSSAVTLIISILILGIGTSYLCFNQFTKCFHMYIRNIALFCQKYMGNSSS